MTFKDDIWGWVKTAPLPVVLAISLAGFTALGSWLWALDAEQNKQSTDVAVAVEKSANAEASARRVEDKMDKANEKLDKLLEAVVKIKAEQEEVARELAAEKKKKENN